MNIRYNILILSIFSLTMIAYGQTYFGIKYPEPVIQKDALDPIYGQRTLDQLRTSELIFSRLWRYNELLILEEDFMKNKIL